MTEPSSINMFDLAVLIVIGLSALLSFYRGFIREVLSLGAWVVASVITLRFMPTASAYIKPQVKSDVIANGIASVGLFFITLILISIATGLLLKILKPGDKVGLLDNLVGLCFGVARGALILSIAYFAMTVVVVEKDYPDWINHSVSRPYVEKAAKWVSTLTPDYLNKISGKDNKPSDADSLGDTSEKTTKVLIRKLDNARKNAVDGMDNAADDIKDDIKEKSPSLPSMEDLQQRIREENEKK